MYRGYMGRLVATFLRDLVLKVIQAQVRENPRQGVMVLCFALLKTL